MRHLISNSLVNDTLKLVSGTVGGRLVLVAAMPLVTRLYSPQDFTLLAVYMALTNAFGVVACLRLDIAIPFAEDDRTAVDLLAAAVVMATLTSLLFGLSALIAPLWLARLLGTPEIAPWLWLVGLGTFCLASYSALQFWATRARRFGTIARTRISQALTGAATMIGFGWGGVAPLGLLLGNMFTTGAGGIWLALDALRHDRALLRRISVGGMRTTVRNHWRYPLFSTPEALANVAGIQVPILIIAAFSGQDAGQLFLTMQVMVTPLMLVGTSVGQVYASRATEEMREGRLRRFTLSIMQRLFLIGLGPMAFMALFSPRLFGPIFGTDWARAGEIATWIAPWMFLQFVVSPVSMALNATENQKAAMLLQGFGLVLRVGVVLLALVFSLGMVEAFAVSGAIFYTIYGATVLHKVANK